MEFNLLTNGQLENYPKKLIGKVFKVKHWRDLGITTEESFNDSLVECLDDVVDFEKTGFIKTTAKLTPEDLKYVFFQQRIQCIGDSIDITYTCEKCEAKTKMKISMEAIKEKKLKNRIKDNPKFKVPSYEDMKDFNVKLTDYIETGAKYLKKNEEDGKNNIEESIVLFLMYYPFMKIRKEKIDEFLDDMMEADGEILKEMKEFMETVEHGFEDEIKMKCRNCNTESQVSVPTSPTFFLS